MTISNRSDLDGMQRVGRLVGEAHAYLATQVSPGISTAELDERGARFLRARGARSAPQLTYGFPGFNLISINDEIVHGVPGHRRLAPGDLVKIDITAELDGFVADAARTIALPAAPPSCPPSGPMRPPSVYGGLGGGLPRATASEPRVRCGADGVPGWVCRASRADGPWGGAHDPRTADGAELRRSKCAGSSSRGARARGRAPAGQSAGSSGRGSGWLDAAHAQWGARGTP